MNSEPTHLIGQLNICTGDCSKCKTPNVTCVCAGGDYACLNCVRVVAYRHEGGAMKFHEELVASEQ